MLKEAPSRNTGTGSGYPFQLPEPLTELVILAESILVMDYYTPLEERSLPAPDVFGRELLEPWKWKQSGGRDTRTRVKGHSYGTVTALALEVRGPPAGQVTRTATAQAAATVKKWHRVTELLICTATAQAAAATACTATAQAAVKSKVTELWRIVTEQLILARQYEAWLNAETDAWLNIGKTWKWWLRLSQGLIDDWQYKSRKELVNRFQEIDIQDQNEWRPVLEKLCMCHLRLGLLIGNLYFASPRKIHGICD